MDSYQDESLLNNSSKKLLHQIMIPIKKDKQSKHKRKKTEAVADILTGSI